MLTMRLPQALGFVFPPPDELPHSDLRVTWMLRLLGDPPVGGMSPTVLASIPDDERDALMCSLATTFTRSRYCVERFQRAVRLLVERRRVAGTLQFDSCAKSAIFEAASALAAMRSVIDEIFWIAARRAGKTPDEAGDWSLETALRCNFSRPTTAQYNVPEVNALRARLGWYDRLNKYRNALTHWGWRLQIGGYFPADDESVEAGDAVINVMLVPDYASLGKTRRAHQWTYADRTRVETVVEDAWDTLADVVHEVGTLWGGTIPPQGSAPPERRPHVIILAPCPALVLQDEILALTFTSRGRAADFQARMFAAEPDLDICEVHPSSLPHGGIAEPGFWLSIPAGQDLAGTLSGAGLGPRDLVVGVDPVLDSQGKRVVAVEGLDRFSFAKLTETDDPMAHVAIPRTNERSRLFVIRRRPNYAGR